MKETRKGQKRTSKKAQSTCDVGAGISPMEEYTSADAGLDDRLLGSTDALELRAQHLLPLEEGCWSTRARLITI